MKITLFQKNPSITIHITGNQWYWNYSYKCLKDWTWDKDYLKGDVNFEDKFKENILNSISFDSYMITDSDFQPKVHKRLLSVDNYLYLPAGCNIRLLITSYDVIHSYAVPEFGLKVDAVPGRLNQTFLYFETTGTFYGQCSELCGLHHSFMPTGVRVVPENVFYNELLAQLYRENNKEKFEKYSKWDELLSDLRIELLILSFYLENEISKFDVLVADLNTEIIILSFFLEESNEISKFDVVAALNTETEKLSSLLKKK